MLNRAATLEQLARLCHREASVPPVAHATGCARLDIALPYGGWQPGTVVELMPVQTGIGELRLLMPTLARISHADSHLAFISPPFIPFAPALEQHGVRLERLLIVSAEKHADALWAIEQTLRCRSFGAVVAWPQAIRDRDIRRLQLAAEAGGSVGFLYRPAVAAHEASPAAVRLRLQRDTDGELLIEVLKCRGARSGFSFRSNEPAATARADMTASTGS